MVKNQGPPPRKHVYPVGTQVGLLTVTGFEMVKRPDGRNRRLIRVRCECNTELSVFPANLASGDTSSCGCLHRKRASEANRTHGAKSKESTPLQKKLMTVWRGMKQRCNNPKSRNYKWYGGKGITVEWNSFSEFYDWAVTNGYRDGLEIDRIDPKYNYCASNCTWSTKGDNIARAHMDINKEILVESTKFAVTNNRTLSSVIEEALTLFLQHGKEVMA